LVNFANIIIDYKEKDMLAPASPDFEAKKIIESNTRAEINLCWTCSSCDMECPVNIATNRLRPQKIVRLANLGFMDELLSLNEIWYCLKCRRCDYVCPNRVKPSTVICYLRKEAFQRNLVSLEMVMRRRILFARFQRVRWRLAEQCLNGEMESMTDDQWYDWLETPINGIKRKISFAELNSSKVFRNAVDNSSIHYCFNCTECTNSCPISSGRNVFDPLWIFHMVHLGLEEEILKSPSIWLCIACQRCTEACSQLVKGQSIIQRLQEMAIEKGIVNRDFLYRWKKAQKIIYPRFIKEIDDLLMDSGSDNLDAHKKIIELHPGRETIIASGFSETNRLKETQGLGARKHIKNLRKASASR